MVQIRATQVHGLDLGSHKGSSESTLPLQASLRLLTLVTRAAREAIPTRYNNSVFTIRHIPLFEVFCPFCSVASISIIRGQFQCCHLLSFKRPEVSQHFLRNFHLSILVSSNSRFTIFTLFSSRFHHSRSTFQSLVSEFNHRTLN